jgi:excisionase family DNA binding protein
MAAEYATIRDVAAYFTVSVSTIRNWVRAETIPASTYIKVGDTYRFNLGKVEEALLNASRNDNTSTNPSEETH